MFLVSFPFFEHAEISSILSLDIRIFPILSLSLFY